ncbi:MAG TPA: hypothetical protein VF503_27695 [Sphingobium sp.]
MLDRTVEIYVDEAVHGPADARLFRFEPTYMLRSLSELHIGFTPA